MDKESMDESKEEPILEIITTEFRTGRKTLCTPELIDYLFEKISTGSTVKAACAMAILTESSYYSWMARGQKESKRLEQDNAYPIEKESIYLDFMESMKKAIPFRKDILMKRIIIAGEENWQANAWMLERLHPDEYGKRTIVKIETWETEIIELIRQGTVTFDQVEAKLGTDTARRLFDRSGETGT